jgi:hypothetical protein
MADKDYERSGSEWWEWMGLSEDAELGLGVCRSMSSSLRFTEANPAVPGSSGSFRHEVADDVSEIVRVQ